MKSPTAPGRRPIAAPGRRPIAAPGVRPLLVALAVVTAVSGGWASFAPGGFFADFPGPGFGGWVAELPPHNRHLTTDVGAFNLAFSLLFAWGAWRPDRALLLPLGAAWTLFSALHLVFHATHLASFATTDAIAQMVSLTAACVGGVAPFGRR